jgi:hypothetical protein
LPSLLALLVGSGCGATPALEPSASLLERPTSTEPVSSGESLTPMVDDCVERPGEPPPEPLRSAYTGLARSARCQREVYTIMGGVTHLLGVQCRHCHLEPDYAADTHNKQVANWMARELVPRLRRVADRDGGHDVWCGDCHAGKPKLLGNPRRRDVAIEWMTTHLVEDFETVGGKPPTCKGCHGGDLGSAEFKSRLILEGPLPSAAPPAPDSAPVAPAAATPAASAPPVPELGNR